MYTHGGAILAPLLVPFQVSQPAGIDRIVPGFLTRIFARNTANTIEPCMLIGRGSRRRSSLTHVPCFSHGWQQRLSHIVPLLHWTQLSGCSLSLDDILSFRVVHTQFLRWIMQCPVDHNHVLFGFADRAELGIFLCFSSIRDSTCCRFSAHSTFQIKKQSFLYYLKTSVYSFSSLVRGLPLQSI
jgi:hypothetical protein